MSHQTDNYQLYLCPEEFQERLTQVGGVNRYDEPNFVIVWGQGGEDRAMFRAGGTWYLEGEASREGYRDLLVGGGVPSWVLLQWHDALEYGTPEMYYVQNHDEDSGYQTLGEYPYTGRYQVLYNLRWAERIDGKLVVEAMPLNSFLLETVVPIIQQARDISFEKYSTALRDIKEREDAADIAMIEDAMRDAALPFKGGPVSYTRQGCKTSIIDKKIESMQKHWNAMISRANSLGKGLSARAERPH